MADNSQMTDSHLNNKIWWHTSVKTDLSRELTYAAADKLRSRARRQPAGCC